LNLSMKQNVGLIAVATPLLLGSALAGPADAGRTWAGVKAADECVPAAAYTETVTEARTETTGWVTAAPDGLGWVQVDERKVIDVAAVEGVEEASHTEYRWAIETRTYTPAVEEVSHMETVIDEPAIEEVSHTETVVVTPAQPDTRVWWVFKGNSEGPPAADDEGWKQKDNLPNENSQHAYPGENGLGNPYNPGADDGKGDWFRFTGIPAADEVTEQVKVIDQPYVPAVTHEEKVIDVEAAPAVFGPWEPDDFTAWQTSSVEPADPDAESGADNPLNLVRLGDRQEHKVVTTEAVAAVEEVSHQEFKFEISFPAVTIEHDAITCPGEPTPDPEPEPEPDDSSVSNPHPEQLPQTGASDTWLLATGALALLGTGTAAMVLVRRRRES
jgi:LPXTG-motif cell wall-anchored protein